jgi:hypothetical protein
MPRLQAAISPWKSPAGLAAALLLAAGCDLPPPPGPPVSFAAEVAPLLDRHCVGCHGPDKARGGYRLDTFAALRQPGNSGAPPVVPGDPAHSDLHARLVHADPEERMPFEAPPLPAVETALVRRWLADGAAFDGADSNAPLASLRPRPAYPAPPARYPQPPPVTALAWRPDGAELATGGRHELVFLDATNLAVTRRVPGFPERVQALAWSPGGPLAAAGGAPGRSGELVLWDPAGTNAPRVLAVTRDLLLAAAFSPDGARLAAAGTDAQVRVFDAATGAVRFTLAQHSDWVHALAWSPDGARLATAGRDRTARVHDAATGAALAAFRGHGAAVEHAAFSTDGRQVLTAGADRRVRFWLAANPDEAGEFASPGAAVTALARSGAFVWLGLADGRVTQRRLVERDEVRAFSGGADRVTALALHEEAGRVAAGFHDGTLRVWNVADGTEVAAGAALPGRNPAGPAAAPRRPPSD